MSNFISVKNRDCMSSRKNKSWEEVLKYYEIENQSSLELDSPHHITNAKVLNKKPRHTSHWSTGFFLLFCCMTAPASITMTSYFPNSSDRQIKTTALTIAPPSTQETPQILTTSSISPNSKELHELSLPAKAITTYSGYNLVNTESTWVTYKVERYDKLADVFRRIKFPEVLQGLQQDKSINDVLINIKPKTIVRVKSSKGKLEKLVFTSDYQTSYQIQPTDDGSYQGTWQKKQFEVRQTRATFFVNRGLYADAQEHNVSRDIIRQLMAVFDWEIDFSKDVKKGDHATIIYENIYHQGDLITNLELLAAEFTNESTVHRSIRHTTAQGLTDYFTPEGREMKRAFIRTPVTRARVSSHFNPKRRHPILNKVRAHTGTDFAAPHGTPIIATGDGKVMHMARKGGYGKTIILKHREGYTTLYSHLSKYKENLKKGHFVAQGDVIGYVGSTGLATGPNLHYEFRKNNIPTNPITAKLPNSMSLTKKELELFKTAAINMKLQLGVLHRLTMERLDGNSDIGG